MQLQHAVDHVCVASACSAHRAANNVSLEGFPLLYRNSYNCIL